MNNSAFALNPNDQTFEKISQEVDIRLAVLICII